MPCKIYCRWVLTWCMRYRHSATTWAHQEAVLLQVHVHDVMRRRSKTIATFTTPLPWANVWGGMMVALRWKPETTENKFDTTFNQILTLFSNKLFIKCNFCTNVTKCLFMLLFGVGGWYNSMAVSNMDPDINVNSNLLPANYKYKITYDDNDPFTNPPDTTDSHNKSNLSIDTGLQ